LGCGDDTFTDFRSWVIAQGRATYERFLSDPDSIVDAGLEDEEELGAAELFAYTAGQVFKERVGQQIWDAFPDRDIAEPDEGPAGDSFDASDDAVLAERYPRLTTAYSDGGGQFAEARGRRIRLPKMLRRKR